jgi:PhzF family phenazine biosynthesis protein
MRAEVLFMRSKTDISLPIYQVDAFTSSPFSGNPAGVCLMQEPLPDWAQQAIASEMNLSETAFVILPYDTIKAINSDLPLRWFTPKNEVPLCGHATLATAAVLFRELEIPSSMLRFQTKSGLLTAVYDGTRFTLDFPADQPEQVDPADLGPLLDAMGVDEHIAVIKGKRTGKYVVHLPKAENVIQLKPDFNQMLIVAPTLTGVGVTAKGDQEYDIVSRYFNPWYGVDEDPVTGTVHTILAPYWADLLQKEHLYAFQASARQGEIHIALDKKGRCLLTGDAVVVLTGNLNISY